MRWCTIQRSTTLVAGSLPITTVPSTCPSVGAGSRIERHSFDGQRRQQVIEAIRDRLDPAIRITVIVGNRRTGRSSGPITTALRSCGRSSTRNFRCRSWRSRPRSHRSWSGRFQLSIRHPRDARDAARRTTCSRGR